MTTDKKSSLAERFKALRDKVAVAMTAAEEEESSVAGFVSPNDSAEASSAPDKRESGDGRATRDDVASALMRFTWANESPIIREQPEEVRVFYEGFQPEADPEAGEKSEAIAADEAGWETEPLLGTDALLAEEKEAEPEPWEKVLAETEALLAQEDDKNASFSKSGYFASAAEAEADPGEKKEAESYREEYSYANDLIDTDSEVSELGGNASRQGNEAETDFNWAELFGEIAEADRAEPVPEKAESIQTEAAEEQQGEVPGRMGSGFAALLASLRKKAEEKPIEQSSAEETPDISMFLQGPGEDQGEPESIAYEPDPSDVARLWEPHAERKTADNAFSDLSIDPVREETHVFTEEDLKNFPKEESDSETGEESRELSDYREPDEDEEGYTPRDFRPIRRRRYYRTGLVGGIMYFLFVLCVSVALACFAWLAADDALSLNKEYIEAEVYVGENMDVEQIATELQTKGLIRYRKLFALFGKFFHAEEKIEPGTYTLSTKLDYRALIQNMHHYTGWTGEELATVKVTIPEGKTVMETFQILAEHGVCPYETLMECAAKETFNYSFLEGIPKGDATRLEGYLFPDTYEFYADSSPKAAICRFLDNFGTKLGDRVAEQAAAQGYTLRQMLTVASLIEKEAGGDLERATIASVIYNRLQSTSYPYLQIDATIQYAMGEHKEHLTYEDLQVDSPYNTYLYPGLPPGPISNPGLASIRAALNPENTGYYFYALNKNGKHEFFTSYNAFQRFINSSDFGG